MIYCIEIDRGGIGEEDVVLHNVFDTTPTREEILEVIANEDIGYDDDYCKFDYYLIHDSEPTLKSITPNINYKGKGEHSVNELEKIIESLMEELHQYKSGQKK